MIKMEILIRDYLKKLSVGFQDYYCVHLHSSKFSVDNKKEYKIQFIEDALKVLQQQGKAKFFHAINEDFFIFYVEKYKDDVNTILLKIKFYFADDENVKKQKLSMYSFYDVSTQMTHIEDAISNVFNETEGNDEFPQSDSVMFSGLSRNSPALPEKFGEIEPLEKTPKKDLTPTILGRAEKSLKQVDFSNIIRRQSVCAIFGKSFPQPLFDEVFVGIPDLQETLMPEVNLASSPWLFKHLTEVLDKGVLLSIGKHDYGSLKMEFSINLNTTTIISSEFGKFDEKINPGVKSTIVLELNPSDIFSDLHTFILARDFAKSKGYRICLDNMSIDLMRYIDKDMLGIDMIKIFWSQKFLDAVNEDKEIVANLIKKVGEDKVVLSRVDDSMAIDVGQSVGIYLFQGRHINSIISSDPRKRRVGSVIMSR